jgi:hypothetical protein
MPKGFFQNLPSFIKKLLGIKQESSTNELINKNKERITLLSDEALASAILHYETWYFECIGEHHPEVIEFQTAIEQRNIQLITEKWSDFFSKFIAYERAVGITGRLYITDCYSYYHLYLDEFEKRQRNK